LATAADIIAHAVPDLRALVSLLDLAGQRRLAEALRRLEAARPAGVGGSPRPDSALWRSGRLK
jgi:hypothetical protein